MSGLDRSWMPGARQALIAASFALVLAVPGFADENEGSVELPPLTFNGLVSASYSHNVGAPAGAPNALRVFDGSNNTTKFDLFEAVIQRNPTQPRQSGFRLDLTAGASVPKVTASAGLFRDPVTGEAQDFDIQQAMACYIADVGTGLRFDIGKFTTHAGAELIEGYDGYNDNYSHSFMFGYAIPFTHTGVKANYAFSSHASAMAMVANGWDNVEDNNRHQTFGAQAMLTSGKAATLYLNWIGGPEQANSSNFRLLYDVVGVMAPHERVKFTLNYDWAQDANAVAPGRNAEWSGFAAYARIGLTSALALNLRAEHFEDRDGVRTGTPQTLEGLTVTPELRVSKGFIVRGEARWDKSDAAAFLDKTGPSDKQSTLAFNVAYVY